jgi:hypothetical protein
LVYGFLNPDRYQIAWFANWFALAAVICIFREYARTATILAALALAIAQDGWRCFFVGDPTNEGGGNPAVLTASSYGFYSWLIAFAWLLAAAIVMLRGTSARNAVTSTES